MRIGDTRNEAMFRAGTGRHQTRRGRRLLGDRCPGRRVIQWARVGVLIVSVRPYKREADRIDEGADMQARTMRGRALMVGAAAAQTTTTTSTTTASTIPPAPRDAHLFVEPDEVTAGSSFKAYGTGCATSEGPGRITAWLTSEGGPVTDTVELRVAADGSFAGYVLVPADLRPDSYDPDGYPFSVRCDRGGTFFFYDVAYVKVLESTTAPTTRPRPSAPRAVPVKPRYTG
jgi:hypothetical protein